MLEPRRSRPPLALVALLALLAAAAPATTQARSAGHGAAGHRARASKKVARPPKVVPNQEGKIVVFPFKDDDDHSISAQVERLFRARGLEVVTGVRRVDTPEQYREMATTLGLVAYVDGTLREGQKSARVTVSVRSGYSGRKVASATFKESPPHVRAEIEDKLWTRLGPVMSRACADAAKPRRRGRGPLLIDAGTPLTPDG